MGKTLLILMAGFAASFGLLAISKNQRYAESVDRMVDQFSNYKSKNAATSGAYMALNKLYLNKAWRAGYHNLVIAGDTIEVTVTDNSTEVALGPNRVKISSTGRNGVASNLSQVVAFNRQFQEFAVWAKDTVISITTQNSSGAQNDSLLIKKAPFMPKIDYAGLANEAQNQGNVETEANFQPKDKYPDPDNDGVEDFYAPDGTTPNVTRVTRNLRVRTGRTVYGIFIVEGDAELERGATVEGILYLPNASSSLSYHASTGAESLVKGGVVTWGDIDGTGGNIIVQHFPSYINKFVTNYAPNNPPLRVLSWK